MKAVPDTGFDFRQLVPYRLQRITTLMREGIATVLTQQVGVSLFEWRVMAFLMQFPGACAAHMCQDILLDKVQVARCVARLKAAAYLRSEPDPQDGRSQRLYLTERGAGAFARTVPMLRAVERWSLDTLTGAERRQLEQLLTKLSAKADAFAHAMPALVQEAMVAAPAAQPKARAKRAPAGKGKPQSRRAR